ncbi:MAG: hypothetical protein AAFN10_00870 [Bacteroidota bacterium]
MQSSQTQNYTSFPIPAEVRVFQPKTSPLMAKAFTEGQIAALGRHNVTKISSSNSSWWHNPFVRGLVLIDIQTRELLGGVRIHLHSQSHPMPMMPVLQKVFPEGYQYVHECSKEPKAEISGIWRSPKAPKATLARLLTSKAIFVAKELGVKCLYGFAGHHSVSILEKEGFGYEDVLCKDQKIPYPDDRYQSKVCFLDLNQDSLFDWAPEVKMIHHGFIAFSGMRA